MDACTRLGTALGSGSDEGLSRLLPVKCGGPFNSHPPLPPDRLLEYVPATPLTVVR